MNDRLSHSMEEGGGKGEGDCPTEKMNFMTVGRIINIEH